MYFVPLCLIVDRSPPPSFLLPFFISFSFLYTFFVSSRIIWSPSSHRSTTNAPSTHPSSTWRRTPRDEGGGGEEEGRTNWSRDCTNPLSTVAVSSISCGWSHTITSDREVKFSLSYIFVTRAHRRKLNVPKISLHEKPVKLHMRKRHTTKHTRVLFVMCEKESNLRLVWKTTDGFHVPQQSHPHFVTTSQYVRCQ